MVAEHDELEDPALPIGEGMGDNHTAKFRRSRDTGMGWLKAHVRPG
jgi:hypothetical protein